jgi:aldehyde dehydrogenase (NAD+)
VSDTTASGNSPYAGFDKLYVGGEWRDSGTGATGPDEDPWSGTAIQEIALASVGDVEEALRSAREAQRGWAAEPPDVRAGVMRAAADIMAARRGELVSWLVRESGSTAMKAALEADYMPALLREAASMPHHATGKILPSDVPGKENRIYRAPVGVVAVISPWNFPVALSSRSVAPALVLGNAVVLKPAEDTPVTGGLFIAKVFEEAGLPPGVLQVLTHSRKDAAVIGDAIVESPIPRFVSFTGSTVVGIGITRKAGVKKLGLELGGNGPLVVLGDADIDLAAGKAVVSSFFHQGQVCTIANRLIVDATVHDAFVEKFTDRDRALKVGDPADADTFIGPVINRRQLAAILGKLQRARDAGAVQLLGGDPVGPARLALPPHVLLGTNDTPTAREEVFGPVITIIRADNDEHALALANDTEFGLSSAVFTRDGERGVQFARQVEAGMCHVNDVTIEDEPHIAFGGEKQSGLGRFGGTWAVEEFTREQWVSVQHGRHP